MRSPHLLAPACHGDPNAAYRHAEHAIWDQLSADLVDHEQWQSVQEGSTVLAADVDEMWDAVRHGHVGLARRAAAQVAATAILIRAELVCGLGDRLQIRALAVEARRRHEEYAPVRAFSSSYEGFGFLRNAFGQLLVAVSADDLPAVQAAALHVAVLALRFIAEVHAGGSRVPA